MNIQDIEIKIKKYDKEKNFVIANLIISGALELRGFVIRYTTTKKSPNSAIWLVNPPSVVGRNKQYFWIARFLDTELWGRLESKMIDEAKNYSNSL